MYPLTLVNAAHPQTVLLYIKLLPNRPIVPPLPVPTVDFV